MHKTISLITISFAIIQFSTAAAGSLDDYYLEQFGVPKNGSPRKTVLSAPSHTQSSSRCGMPLKKGLRRDWKLLEPATQKTLAKHLALPVLSGVEQIVVSSGGHFRVHYTNSGTDSPNIRQLKTWPELADITTTAAWAGKVAETFEQVYSIYVSPEYNYRTVPLPTSNLSGQYDIYLQDLADRRLYGFTEQPSQSNGSVAADYWIGKPFPNSAASYIVLDNDFADDVFTMGHGAVYSPLQSLQITAAHEYHHAIQFGYNYYFDVWYAEAVSTWMEDELFDSVNQLYNYTPEWFTQSSLSLDITESTATGGGYGRWIFNRYLAEKHPGEIIRGVWERLAGVSSPGNGEDIPMAPVLDSLLLSSYGSSLGNDLLGFAKRVYTRDWGTHISEIDKIHACSPIATYSAYPVNSGNVQKPSVTLPHYSFAYYRFSPVSTAQTLTITVSRTSGIRTALFKNTGGNISEITLNIDGRSYSVADFGTTDEVMLLIVNSADVDDHQANFSTDGSIQTVIEPAGGSVYSQQAGTNSPGSSSSGCFIATAAYGSYLHPHVRLLRKFRDEQLMTNAPGRTFVALYYRFSPPLAELVSSNSAARIAAILFLTPVVGAVAHPLMTVIFLMTAAFAVRRRRISVRPSQQLPL